MLLRPLLVPSALLQLSLYLGVPPVQHPHPFPVSVPHPVLITLSLSRIIKDTDGNDGDNKQSPWAPQPALWLQGDLLLLFDTDIGSPCSPESSFLTVINYTTRKCIFCTAESAEVDSANNIEQLSLSGDLEGSVTQRKMSRTLERTRRI